MTIARVRRSACCKALCAPPTPRGDPTNKHNARSPPADAPTTKLLARHARSSLNQLSPYNQTPKLAPLLGPSTTRPVPRLVISCSEPTPIHHSSTTHTGFPQCASPVACRRTPSSMRDGLTRAPTARPVDRARLPSFPSPTLRHRQHADTLALRSTRAQLNHCHGLAFLSEDFFTFRQDSLRQLRSLDLFWRKQRPPRPPSVAYPSPSRPFRLSARPANTPPPLQFAP